MIDWQSICRIKQWPHMRKLSAALAVVAVAAGIGLAAARLGTTSAPSPRKKAAPRLWMMTDSVGDGTPDFLRLDDRADRASFRRWFTFLAEIHFFRSPQRLPRDIVDCAALLRFAYRESLKRHDGVWADGLDLDVVPPAPDLAAYHYPFTPLKASLFRVRPGRFAEPDIAGRAFAEFADAETLMRLNTWRVSGNLEDARPADLLFFRQVEQRMPFHAMIYLGTSQFEPSRENYIVYHTGPDGRDPGAIRRPSAGELMHHPKPQWRPVAGNPYFLGVYRWNILVD